LDDDGGRIVVQLLVDVGHNAVAHQLFYDFDGTGFYQVGQLPNRNCVGDFYNCSHVLAHTYLLYTAPGGAGSRRASEPAVVPPGAKAWGGSLAGTCRAAVDARRRYSS